jgi:hypothetical protein
MDPQRKGGGYGESKQRVEASSQMTLSKRSDNTHKQTCIVRDEDGENVTPLSLLANKTNDLISTTDVSSSSIRETVNDVLSHLEQLGTTAHAAWTDQSQMVANQSRQGESLSSQVNINGSNMNLSSKTDASMEYENDISKAEKNVGSAANNAPQKIQLLGIFN